MTHVAGGEIGEIAFRQRLQRKARTTRAQRKYGAVTRPFEDNLRAIGQLAHDVVKHMCRHGRRTAGGNLGCGRVRHFKIEIRGFQAQLAAVGLHQDVGENWNGIAALDHAMDVAQRLQKLCTLYGNFHGNPAPARSKRPLNRRNGKPAIAECEAGGQR